MRRARNTCSEAVGGSRRMEGTRGNEHSAFARAVDSDKAHARSSLTPLFSRSGLFLAKRSGVSGCPAGASASPGIRVSGQMTYEYRVFIVHDGEESTFSHFSSEKLWEGAVLRVSKPGAELDGLSVAVHRVVSHPTDHGPGIAYERGADRGSD